MERLITAQLGLGGDFCSQAFAQVCAFRSPFCGMMSVMAMFRQLTAIHGFSPVTLWFSVPGGTHPLSRWGNERCRKVGLPQASGVARVNECL
jgi:hypothetical protein